MKDITILNKILRGICAFRDAFLQKKIYCLGVYCRTSGDRLYYALMGAGSDSSDMMERAIITTGSAETMEDVLCDILQYEISKPIVVIAKGDNEIFLLERSFPAMQEKDIKGAVYWELEINGPKMENRQLSQDYVYGYVSEAVDQGYRVRIGATKLEDIACLVKIINAFGYQYAGMAVVDSSLTDVGKAVAGANSYMDVLFTSDGYEERLMLGRNFLLSPMINWSRIGAVVLSFMLGFSILTAGIGVYVHKEYIAEQKVYQQRLALLQDVSESMDRANQVETEISRLDAELARHKDEGIPAEALMVHLGSIITKGVALTEASANKEAVNIKGSAISYNALTKFYKVLEKDKNFFSNGASLEKSEIEKNGQRVGFSIKGRI